MIVKQPEIGARIYELRVARGLTLIGCAKICGTSHPYLSRLENNRVGSPTIGWVEKFCEGLHITMAEFLVPEQQDERMLHDPFVRAVCSIVKQLDSAKMASILKVLAAAPVTKFMGGRKKA